jgi:deoxyhypusine synthase
LTDLSFTGERKDWVTFRKSIRKVVDEKNMDLVITTGATMSKFFIEMDAENAAAAGDKW